MNETFSIGSDGVMQIVGMEDTSMTALIKFFRSGSRFQETPNLDSHLLQDLGLSRVLTEHAERNHSMQKSIDRDSCNNSDNLAA